MDKGFTADDVRVALGQGVLGVSGSLQRPVIAPAPLDRIVPGALTFCRHGSERLDQALVAAAGATLICAEPREIGDADITLIAVENPRLGFIRAVSALFSLTPPSGIDPTARVVASARIHPTASIGAYAVIGNSCVVGPGSVLHPHVVLYPNVRIGAGVVVHAGTVIGADGFGYERNDSGDLEKFPHFGGVVIEDDVEIGSNTSIDRGTLGDTVIGAGSRIDNQVHIAHNVVLGRSVVVIAQSMIGGGVRIGDRAWVAPSASILNQITVGEGAVIGLGAVVVKHVEAGVTVMGVPAVPADRFKAGRKTP